MHEFFCRAAPSHVLGKRVEKTFTSMKWMESRSEAKPGWSRGQLQVYGRRWEKVNGKEPCPCKCCECNKAWPVLWVWQDLRCSRDLGEGCPATSSPGSALCSGWKAWSSIAEVIYFGNVASANWTHPTSSFKWSNFACTKVWAVDLHELLVKLLCWQPTAVVGGGI